MRDEWGINPAIQEVLTKRFGKDASFSRLSKNANGFLLKVSEPGRVYVLKVAYLHGAPTNASHSLPMLQNKALIDLVMNHYDQHQPIVVSILNNSRLLV